MKTTITIDSNPVSGTKVTIQVDDEQPVQVNQNITGLKTEPNRAFDVDLLPLRPPEPIETPKAERSPKETECADCGLHFYSETGKRKFCPSCVAKRQQAGRDKRYKERHAVRAGNPTIPIRPPNPPVPVRKVDDPDSEAGEVTRAMKQQRADFDDPWNCNMCRNAGDLCTMHENMTKLGQKPPRRIGAPA